MKTQTNVSVRYSEAFKMQVVEEITSGKFTGINAASRAYGIKGATTVRNWLKKYGHSEVMPKKITINTVEEIDEKKQLQKRVKQLEKALADAYMKNLLSETYFEVACERFGEDPEEFKKKHVTKLSQHPRKKAKK